MTRHELGKLKAIAAILNGEPGIACVVARRAIDKMTVEAEREHTSEDRHHDAAEADTYPMNIAAE